MAGKVALVTGAARGLGSSHCIRLAEEGADIIAIDVAEPHETVERVKSLGRAAVALSADVRDRPRLASIVAQGVAELGGLQVVVANAGVSTLAAWDQVTETLWQDTLDVNLTGTWNTIQLCAPHLVSAGGGSIILTSSTAGLKGPPFLSAYAASKHGVVGLMRAYATELGEYNIRVNAVNPTGVNTAMGPEKMEALMVPLLAAHPQVASLFSHRLPVTAIEPIDVSNAVLFLASDESRYVTSLALTIDAGNVGH